MFERILVLIIGLIFTPLSVLCAWEFIKELRGPHPDTDIFFFPLIILFMAAVGIICLHFALPWAWNAITN